MISNANLLFGGSFGRIDNLVFRRYGDKIVVSKAPDMSRRKLSIAQKMYNERMKFAVIYAKKYIANPRLKQQASEALGVPLNRVYHAIIRHYLRTGEVDIITKETPRQKQDRKVLKEFSATIEAIAPGTQIMLFGERTRPSYTENSSWDLLLLTKDKLPAEIQWQLKEQLQAIGMPFAAQVNPMIVYHNDWLEDARYQPLRNRIQQELVDISMYRP